MADNITLTASIRSNLLSLQNTNSLLNRTSERLSTGLRVNSALDDPGAFFTARGLTNRANDLAKLKDGIGQAIQTINATDTALSSITALVEQAASIADQAVEAAANAGTNVASVVSNAADVAASTTSTFAASFTGITATDTFTVAVTGSGSVTITASQTIASVLSE
ncbi:MAG: flagellin, partial [Rhodospirillaceae bacterium]|nr:flagellin [Rhodospirillaceae bacterium]